MRAWLCLLCFFERRGGKGKRAGLRPRGGYLKTAASELARVAFAQSTDGITLRCLQVCKSYFVLYMADKATLPSRGTIGINRFCTARE